MTESHPQRRYVGISSCIQCPYCMVDTHDNIPDWCLLPFISQRSERDKVLDDYCNIDLTYYVWGEMQSDDVGLCQGKTCNYCGRYNAELHQQSKQEEQG